jgi:hypothetical protein
MQSMCFVCCVPNQVQMRLTTFLSLPFLNIHNKRQALDISKSTKMSSKKTSKIVVKSEVTTATSKKRKRSKESDGDSSDAEDDDANIRLASA